MTELEKIQYAKYFIDKLANGINPIDNTLVPEDELINNIRISRCMFFVSDILRQVIDNGGINNGGIKKKPNKNRMPFSITDEQLSKYPFSDAPIPISQITERINTLIDTETMKPISYKAITQWLMSIELLKEDISHDGKKVKCPTEKAHSFGIFVEERQGQNGTYHVVLYDKKAQEFIIDNMQVILNCDRTENEGTDLK